MKNDLRYIYNIYHLRKNNAIHYKKNDITNYMIFYYLLIFNNYLFLL